MLFEQVLGQHHLKKHLTTTIQMGRVPHAQLFVGPEGSGTLAMAIAYAQYLLCGNKGDENEGGNAECNIKCANLTHPDLHFAFPVSNSDKVKSHAVSDYYLAEWRQFVKEQPYGNLFDWYRTIGIEKKQGQIGVDEAQDIVKKLTLKSYEGGYKVLIMWMAEKMNTSAANKLLKLIEEPPHKTVLLLIAEDEEQLINTIRSRCQLLQFGPLPEPIIAERLLAEGATQDEANRYAHEANGNYNKALDLLHKDSEDLVFERWFVQWVRTAFKAKGNKSAIHELLLWSDEVSKTGREVQKKFLLYCLSIIRQALLINYSAKELVYTHINVDGFALEKFAPFVHENNVENMTKELEDAMLHVERNGNSKLIFTDLSIKLTRLLHSKAN
ncbi:DNA polymerase III subunit delta' [Flavobacterium sp. ASW18X]|uniref:DNA polymerase III subunit n=1 Tax=Flavobacterium sp. ASW18X TaxID=2572595 RepID=UPI0010AE8F6D|nr:DNA polymerase III subunit delta' [Flavobacterium sp. ASW18X]TKD65113.1 DNA polymerase III subunit delta' [Flavobacterium sp. ASW18X]